MDEQKLSAILLAINDMKESVDDLRMNLKEMRITLKSTTALLKHLGNSENEVTTEDVISSKVLSNTSKVNVENVSAVADTSVGKVFPLQPMVTVNPYEYCSYLFDIKVAGVDWNGETSSEWKFGVVKNVLESRLAPVCENDSVNVLSLFVSKMTSGSRCCIHPLVIAAKPPPKPPDASLNMLGQTNQVLSIVSKISCDMFKSIRFTGSSKKDAASTKCLVFVSWFISVYIIELSRFHFALTECVKSGVSALLDVIVLVRSIDEYGICNTVGLKNGDKDEISCYFRHKGNNQWLFAIVVRSES
ncbi:hypothetical protein QQ045_000970 [Rhodiola kirilowii]